MTRTATIYNLLIASPSDLSSERQVVRDTVLEWNVANGKNEGLWIEPVGWESHSIPEIGRRPQAILNSQLLDQTDIVVAMFWSRLGTPTGKAPSGTVEEIKKAHSSGKQVLLYFSTSPVPRGNIDPKEITRLDKFKQQCRENGLYHEFDGLADLKTKLSRHLSRTIQLLRVNKDVPIPLRNYCEQYPSLATPTDILAQRVRTSADSFMAAAEAIVASLKPGEEVLATDAFNPRRELALYWATDGLQYLQMNFEAAKRGVKIRRIFIAEEKDLKGHRALIHELCRLQSLSGVIPSVVRYEDLEKDLRREFAVFGRSFADEVIYDYFSRDVVDNYIWWAPQVIESFRRKATLIESKRSLGFPRLERRARSFQVIQEAADKMRARFGKRLEKGR